MQTLEGTEITHGELFAGVSGFGLGFAGAGIKTVWRVEINRACQSVLRRRYPETVLLADVREVGKHNLAPVTIISFGSPCQGLSVAGKRKGFDNDRSALFFEAIRVVAELDPDFAVWENVPGALTSNAGRDFVAVLNAFRGIGARDIAWRTLDAQYYGVPQRRRRVFLVADFRAERAAEVLFESESLPGDTPPRRQTGAEVAAVVAGPIRVGGQYRADGDDTLIAGTLTAEFAEQSGNGMGNMENGVIPVAFSPQAGGNTGLNINDDLSGTLQENQVMAVAFVGNNTQGPVDVAAPVNASQQRNEVGSEEISCTLQSKDSGGYSLHYGPIIGFDQSRGQYTGDVAAPLRVNGAVSPGVNDGKPDNMCVAILDNGQGDPNAEMSDVSYCLNGQGNQGVGPRRLTPLECERLQGFLDEWTAGQSDSARYRQMGNAVAVPVTRWIGQRLMKSMKGE